MLIGRYEAKVQTKNQIAFPKKFREILGNKLVITKGFTNYLIVVSEKNWEALLEGTEGKPFTNRSARETQRFLLGNAAFVELDTQGRFVLPDYLRKHAEIDTEVVCAGIKRFVEIWNKKKWEDHQEELSENITFIAEKLTSNENN